MKKSNSFSDKLLLAIRHKKVSVDPKEKKAVIRVPKNPERLSDDQWLKLLHEASLYIEELEKSGYEVKA